MERWAQAKSKLDANINHKISIQREGNTNRLNKVGSMLNMNAYNPNKFNPLKLNDLMKFQMNNK